MKQVGLIILALIVWVTPKSVFALAADQVLFDMIGPDSSATDFMPVISTCTNLDANPASAFTTMVSYLTPVDRSATLTRYQMVVSDIDEVGQPTDYSKANYTLRIWRDPIEAGANPTDGTVADCEIVYNEHITELTHFGERELVPMWNIPTTLLTLDIRHCNITIPKDSAVVIGVHAVISGDEYGRVMISHSRKSYDLPVVINDHSDDATQLTYEVGARLRGKLSFPHEESTGFASTEISRSSWGPNAP